MSFVFSQIHVFHYNVTHFLFLIFTKQFVNKRFVMASLDDGIIEEHYLSLHEIQDALECIVCLDVPKSDPVYQCDNGHILCSSCHPNVSDCPMCRVKLGRSRNLAVERVLAKFPRPCEFDIHGCQIKMTKEALDVHTNICSYKPVPCLSSVCKELIPMVEMPAHMNDIHHVFKTNTYSIHYENMSKYMKSNVQFNPAHFTFDEKDFFSFCWRTFHPQNCWHIWLYMVGTPEESQKYNYHVKITGLMYKEEFSYTGQPVSLHIGRDAISLMNRCLTIHDGGIERFCDNNRLNIFYKISRCDES